METTSLRDRVLLKVQETPNLTADEIATTLRASKASVRVYLSLLYRAGALEVSGGPDDKRRFHPGSSVDQFLGIGESKLIKMAKESSGTRGRKPKKVTATRGPELDVSKQDNAADMPSGLTFEQIGRAVYGYISNLRTLVATREDEIRNLKEERRGLKSQHAANLATLNKVIADLKDDVLRAQKNAVVVRRAAPVISMDELLRAPAMTDQTR